MRYCKSLAADDFFFLVVKRGALFVPDFLLHAFNIVYLCFGFCLYLMVYSFDYVWAFLFLSFETWSGN